MGAQSEDWMTAARVLRHCGFGISGREVDAVVAVGLDKYLSAALAMNPNADPGAIATPVPSYPIPAFPAAGATRAEWLAFFQQVWAQLAELQVWWLTRMVSIWHPLHEKLTWIWHDHFATSIEKVGHPNAMAAQNEKLRTLARGDFRELVRAMITDPAMVYWLDAQKNTAKAPNENLARETMELFCLGHDNGYTEKDVKAAAASLTGLTLTPDWSLAFDPALHDFGNRDLLGLRGPVNGLQFLDAALAKPESPRFIAGKLWRYFASDAPPSAAALERTVAAYGLHRNIGAAVQSILSDPEFLSGSATRVITPVEWVVGAVRALKIPVRYGGAAGMLTWLQAVGQAPFAPPNVGGWPMGGAWLTTSAIAHRAAVAMTLAKNSDLSVVEQAAESDRVDAVGYLLGIGAWTDPSAKTLRGARKDPEKLTAMALNSPEYLSC